MDIIKTNFSHNLNTSKYFQKDSFVFLDIETTGLNRKKDIIYLIGFLYFNFENNQWELHQYFADNPREERSILENTAKLLDFFHHIITYNGNSFDLPFIEERMNFWNINYKINKEKSFDLYKIVRENKDFLNLPNLKLKTIEEYLGYFREDEYSGYECIQFYKDYLITKNSEYRRNVLKHNYDDLFHMLDIMQILDIIDSKRSVFIKYNEDSLGFILDNMTATGDLFDFQFISDSKLNKNIKYYGQNYSLVSEDKKYLRLAVEYSIGYVSEREKGYYIDLLDFGLDGEIEDNSGYNLPNSLLLLKVDSKYCTENILNLFKFLFKEIYQI